MSSTNPKYYLQNSPLNMQLIRITDGTNQVALIESQCPGQFIRIVPNDSTLPSCNNVDNEGESRKTRHHNICNYVHISDRSVPPHAIAVLPLALQIRRNIVSPRRLMSSYVRFGPVRGVNNMISHRNANELICQEAALGKPIFLLTKNTESVIHIDVSDKDKSNWFSLLPLGDQNTANVWLYEEDNELYGFTTQSIGPRTALCIGYSREYAKEHGLPEGQPVLDLNEELLDETKQWWCYECNHAMASSALLQRHIDVYHKEDIPNPRRRYRCKYCTQTFCRLFTLKRHLARHCCKKPEKPVFSDGSSSMNTEVVPDVPISELNTLHNLESTTQNIDENRLPSDESLQNYTNNLDFSISLFDADRIALDISGSSRSDVDFNPYSVEYKDDSELKNDVFANGPQSSSSPKKVKKKKEEPILIKCPRCSQTIVRAKLRSHIRTCTGRRFECECGRVFIKKNKLAEHIHSEHPPVEQSKTDSTKSDDVPYKCEVCTHKFKRRGMLVNHLWRVHKRRPTAVPLERRVRHYPCGACPKIYRTAAKRDRHVHRHHPGADIVRAQWIEGGRRACEPAACSACPRQYATRSKLLQHMRLHHPHLAPPVRAKNHGNKNHLESEQPNVTNSVYPM